MLPRIKLGDEFRCIKTIQTKKDGVYYKEGKTYICELETIDPTTIPNKDPKRKFACGFITNEKGNKEHLWAYFPEENPISQDKYTDYFTKIDK